MSQSNPPILEYRAPSDAAFSPLRKKAVRHARGNGIGSVGLALCFGTIFFGFLENGLPRSHMAIVAVVLPGLLFVAHFTCGILYLIAGAKIRHPNIFWEKTLMVSAAVHMAVVALIWIIASFGLPDPVNIMLCMGSLVYALVLASLVQMFFHVRGLRRGVS